MDIDLQYNMSLITDVNKVLIKYNGLRVVLNYKLPVELFGKITIKDDLGCVQGVFDIRIEIPKQYPHAFPKLFELSEKIPRVADYHIASNGEACVEIEQKKILVAQKGITIEQFLDNYVYKYLCWQILKTISPQLEDWPHYSNGTLLFYCEQLKTRDINIVRKFLFIAGLKLKWDNNEDCFCNSKITFEDCHKTILDELLSLGTDRLIKDLWDLNLQISKPQFVFENSNALWIKFPVPYNKPAN